MSMKKILAAVLCVAMVLGTMGFTALADEPTAVTALLGSGTEADPYLISNVEELKFFSADVNSGNTYAGEYVLLTEDIDLSGEVWTPIGTSIYDKAPTSAGVKMFAGNFDGGNHTIYGLNSDGFVPNAEDTKSTEYSFALFGYVYGANISNVKLADVNINGGTRTDSEGNEVYGSGVAALIGYYFVEDGKTSVIENCHVLSGSVSASNNMGGLIGFMDSQTTLPTVDITIRNCSNAAAVTSEAREAGGILGLLNGSRENGVYTVTMRGTITFENCVNTGAITTLSGGGTTCAGGILGKDQNEASGQRLKIVFDKCTNKGTITVNASGETHVAGLGTSYYSHGSWMVAVNSSNEGDIVVVNDNGNVFAGGLFAYAGVIDLIDSRSTGAVPHSNVYVGDVNHVLFLEGMDNCKDSITGATYYLNGGVSPEYAALVDDAPLGGNFHMVETAYRDGFEFKGWYDNPEFTGSEITELTGNNIYYAKWEGNVAKIGNTEYKTLQDAIDASNGTGHIELLPVSFNEKTIKLPEKINGLTISGAAKTRSTGKTTIKNTTIMTPDGNTVTWDGLTIEGIVFENSNIVMTGWRTGDVLFKNITITNNEFRNIDNASNNAAIHVNTSVEAGEAISGLTITNNIFDGITGGSKSAIYAQVDGNTIISGNVINNVAFRPYIIQVADNTGIADSFVVENNIFSGSAAGRAQALGSGGTDAVDLKVNNNIFKDITQSQQICYWSFNDNTTADFSHNYYDIDAENNTDRFYYNGASADPYEMIEKSFYPLYTELENETTIDLSSLDDGTQYAEAKIGERLYVTINDAIAAAKAGDTVTLVKDLTYALDASAFTAKHADDDAAIIVPAGKELTLDLAGNTISVTATLPAGAVTKHSGAIINNGKLTVADSSADECGKIVFEYVGVYDDGYKRHGAIMNTGTLVVNGGTIENITEMENQQAIDTTNYSGTDVSVTVNGGTVKSAGYYAIDMVGYYDFAPARANKVTINGGVIDGGIYQRVQANTDISVAVTGGTVKAGFAEALRYRVQYAGCAHSASITGGTFTGAIRVQNATSEAVVPFIAGGVFDTNVGDFVAEGYDLSRTGTGYEVIEDVISADTIKVEFEKATSKEGELLYNINLKGADGETINRLNSADLTFDFDPTAVVDGKMKFEIIDIANDNIHVAPVNNSKVRYEFHFDTKTDVNDTANSITIAQVKFTGYGTFDFAVDATANDTNAVHATTYSDNLVDTFVVGGAAGLGTLDISAKLEGVENTVPTRKLTVEITFPNAIEYNNTVAYQDMKVTIVGGNQNIEVDLAAEADYTFTKVLPYNTAYTVTVSGAGYRTATYTVQLTEDKTLNFWNNVMDRELEVEVKNSTSKTVKNFLAGDIVGDDEINIYDLSAAVSYFGTNTKGDAKYSKYDLNRDGKIDSKDVAFILVSWGE